MGLGFAFSAGLVSFLSPCVLPLVPVYLAYLSGASFDQLTSVSRWRTTTHAVAFIAGFSLIFIALGASATYVGQALLDYRLWVERAGGAFLLVLGLWMLGLLPIHFLYKDIRVHLAEKPAGYLGSMIVGAAFAAGWTPCVGPVLASILFMAARSESVWRGVLLLAVYSAGLAVPLLLCSLALETSMRWIRRASSSMMILEKATGALIAAMGLMLALGFFSRVTSWTLGHFTGWARAMSSFGL